MINIGKKRECFFDDYLIDNVRTTAETRIHQPIRRERVFLHDAPWEGDGCNFHNFFYDESIGKYRMYYLGWDCNLGMEKDSASVIRVCYAESEDGKNWVRPNLGIYSYKGSTDNNILFDKIQYPRLDNFMVFRDENPACPAEEKYKAVLRRVVDGEDWTKVHCDFVLLCMVSPDGIHWKDGWPVHLHAAYDSLNVAFWDKETETYRCYFRWNHVPGDRSTNMKMGLGIRDVRYIESKDFKNWSEPIMLDFGDSEDTPLYTSLIQPYYRAPQILIGFPTRYIERKAWTKCYDELCGVERRKLKMEKFEPREGLALTDCIFMASHHGWKFKRYDEAFMRPDEEHEEGWIYGSCYPARGIFEAPCDIEGADPEMSMLCCTNHLSGQPAKLYRYSLRRDGFVSLHAGAVEKMLVTKPFVYDGKDMRANIATSARGYMYFTLRTKEGETIHSCEMFGNATDKKIGFGDSDVEKLCGKEVVLEVRMLDADIYAIRFE